MVDSLTISRIAVATPRNAAAAGATAGAAAAAGAAGAAAGAGVTAGAVAPTKAGADADRRTSSASSMTSRTYLRYSLEPRYRRVQCSGASVTLVNTSA